MSAFRAAREANRGLVHGGPIEISRHDCFEPEELECCGHIGGVVRRVGQPRDIAIGAVSDDQGHPCIGKALAGDHHEQERKQTYEKRRKRRPDFHPYLLPKTTLQ